MTEPDEPDDTGGGSIAATAGPERPDDGMPGTDRPCAICGRPSVIRYRPFCSKRCADVDLHRWLGGHYAIPAAETDDPDSEERADGR